MKLLVVDHNALEPTNRVLYEQIVGQGGVDLRLLVPSSWHNTFRMIRFSPPKEKLSYQLFSGEVLFPSRTHRMVYLSLYRHLKQFQPDVLYINAEPENFQTFEAAMLCNSSKTRLVFSSWRNIDHSIVGYPYRFGLLHKWIERYVLGRASHGIVFNRTGKTIFAKNGFPNTTFIPPPVDTSVFTPHAERDAEKEKFVIGYCGRLVEEKGVDLILHAMKTLPDVCSAIIIGDGPAKQKLEKLATDLALNDRVIFKGGIPQPDISLHLREIDVVVLPSKTTAQWKEQFGRVLIEAMACGVPVIGSTSGEIPDVIGEAGLVFKEGSVEGLRLGIEHLLLSLALRNELKRKGLRRVGDCFSLQVVATQYNNLFRSL